MLELNIYIKRFISLEKYWFEMYQYLPSTWKIVGLRNTNLISKQWKNFWQVPRVVFGVSLSLNHKSVASDFNSLPDAFAKMVPAGIIRKKIVKKSALLPIATKFGTQKGDSLSQLQGQFQPLAMKNFDTKSFENLEKMVGDAGRIYLWWLLIAAKKHFKNSLRRSVFQ